MNFIIGHPRSGTMFASRLLETSRLGVSVHELLFALSWDAVSVPSEYYAGRASRSTVATLLKEYQRRDPWVEVDSNWKLTWILPVLREVFPDARIVHLVRDPRATIRSCCALDYYGRPAPATDEPTRRRSYWLEWMPTIRRDDWSELSQLERNCVFWTETQRLALEAAASDNYLLARVEDLERDEPVERLTQFLGLAPPSPTLLASLRAAGRLNIKAHEKLSLPCAWDEETFERLCGSTAASLGYR